MQYQLKIQQLVTYSRCRIYRNFLNTILEDKNIHTNGSSHLYHFMTLCSLANFRTSRIRIDSTAYTIAPGEWMMPVKELAVLFHKKTEKSTVEILAQLQAGHYIQYTLLNRNRYVKFKINDWHKFNTAVEDTAPCTKDDGFFFFPYQMTTGLLGKGKCSEMDIVLDLWLNTIYRDERIAGSDVGPVVYYRNGSHSPLTGYEELAGRWGVSKSTAGRILRKLEQAGYIKLVAFQGTYGTAIYLCNYLSTMFNISDVVIDKEEVAMSLNIRIRVPADDADPVTDPLEAIVEIACQNDESVPEDAQISVSEVIASVPESHLLRIIKKAAKIISLQGLTCASCVHARYILSPLSDDCKRKTIFTELLIRCGCGDGCYRFALEITPEPIETGRTDETKTEVM